MEEDNNSDVKPFIPLFFLEEKPDIRDIQMNSKEDRRKSEIIDENLDCIENLPSNVTNLNLDNMQTLPSNVKDQSLDFVEHLELKVNDQNFDGKETIEEESSCNVNSQSQVNNENLGFTVHVQVEENAPALGIVNHIKPERNAQILGSTEQVKLEMNSKCFGIITCLRAEAGAETLDCTDVKSEPNTKNVGSMEHIKSEIHPQNFGGIEPMISMKFEVNDAMCDNSVHPKSEQVENISGIGVIGHSNPKLSDESVDGMADEKSCIAALRASVAAYSVNRGREETDVELFSTTERSSQEMLASNADETDQEPVVNCPSDLSTREWRKTKLRNLGKKPSTRRSSRCPKDSQKFSQSIELKKVTTMKTSQSEEKMVQQEKSSNSRFPFPCIWCPYVYLVDCERDKQHSHSKESIGPRGGHTYSHFVNRLYQAVDSHPETGSRSSYLEKQLSYECPKLPENILNCNLRNRNCSSQRTSVSSMTLSANTSMYKCVKSRQAKPTCLPNISNNLVKVFTNMEESKQCKKITLRKSINLVEKPTSSTDSHLLNKHLGREQCFKADSCGKTFGLKSEFSTRKKTRTLEKPYWCDLCALRFCLKRALFRHLKTHTDEKHYTCDICGKGFRHSRCLAVHKRKHTGEKPYKCDKCGKTFRCSTYLYHHKRMWSGERPYKCDVCGKEFGQRLHLSEHKQIHLREKPYKCDVCGKEFRHRRTFLEHKSVHTDERLYKCDVCGKAFKNSSGLREHKSIHTTERPFSCDVCDKAFGSKKHLSRHKGTHASEKPHKCGVCGKGFRSRPHLSIHETIHTGEKPWHCDVCGKAFRHSSLLSVHKKKTHKNIDRE